MLIANKKYKNLVLLSLLVTILLFLFEVIPTYSGLVSMTIDVFEQNSEIDRITENDNVLRELNRQIKLLKMQIYNNVSDYSEYRNLSTVINLLDSLSKESKINNIAINPGELKKENHLWLQPIEISLNAEYENIYNYIRFLENSSRIVKVQELIFKPLKPGSPKLSLKANIEVYLNL